jgi:antitoxin (DNA-binding transcriptional repressor) of toxin-antitoxin stability system
MTKKKSGERLRGRVREAPTEYRVPRKVSATDAARNFSEILNRVRYRGESFLIERGGEVICEIRPTGTTRFTGRDLVALFKSLPPVDEDYLDAVEQITRSQPRLPESPWES